MSRALGIRVQLLELDMRGAAHVVLARQLSMYLVHVCCGLNYAEVGRVFNRDRTTAAYATAQIEERRESGSFDHAVDSLERALRSSLRRFDDQP
ncbi:MAG: chromosomal replication initiator DnaA [Hyphomicrobiaceae bacterium]|nr:chromosomal replication initiator DnaA [Hyphomicrobiaceae bacterium]